MDATQSGDRWAVGLAPRALGELKKLKRNRASLDIVWAKFRELSSGKIISHSNIYVNNTISKIPIYRARLSNDLRIIYQIDIVPDKLREYDHQVIKILRIDSRARINYDLWVRVSSYLYHKYESSEYQKRCKFGLSTGAHIPYKFPHDKLASNGPSNEEVEDESQDEILIALGSGKYVAATKTLYNQIISNEDIVNEPAAEVSKPKTDSNEFHPMGRIRLPSDPDPYQYTIISHRGASIVIGRSGTGKTTALIYKMNSIEESATTFIRQMLVTRSPVLAKHVESSFRRLVDSISMESEAAEELGELPKDLDQALVEFDNEADLREDLPPRFSMLEDSHFPLFISFGKLCSLIQADMYEDDSEETRQIWSARPLWELAPIGYKEFKEVYWPRFKSADQFGLNPSLVYSEILGVIKGYSEVIERTDGYLSEDQYIFGSVAARVSAHLDASVKTQIYSIFKQYRKLKGERFELDQADLSHGIHEFLNRSTGADKSTEVDIPMDADGLTNPESSESDIRIPSIDYLYVDEVQDNLMTDIRVLRGLCKNIDNTYWGGDTAQTILAGSAFRISDLGSYIHTEVYDCNTKKQKPVASSSAPSKFELTINYRSHEGLVQFAASIVDSLYSLFPDSLDHMDREAADDKSTKDRPVLFTDTSSDISIFEKFLMNSASSLGAQQAILVRSEETVHELSSHIAKFCPIMTIPDSKGLEFDDILLYNFFTESESSSSWELVHGYSSRSHRNQRDSIPPLSLCNELKLLYVAITRARKRCWIWDHGGVVDAMKQFWQSQDLISTISITDTVNLGRSSNSAQWIMKGQEYFANGMYKLAAGCFGRGGPEADTSHRIAMAYYRMSQAKIERLRSDTSSSRDSLCAAAKELGDCAGQTHGQSARHLWFHSAICLELAHKIFDASDAFIKAELYERAIRTLLDQNHVKRGVKILLEYDRKLDSRVKENLLDYFRRYYFERNEYDSLPPLFYNNLEDQLSYARKNGFWKQFKDLLEHYKRFDQLANVHIEGKEIFEGLDWLFKAFDHHRKVSSLNRAAKVVIEHAEWNISFDSKTPQHLTNQLTTRVQRIITSTARVRPTFRKQLKAFTAIINQRLSLNLVKEWDENISEERPRKALLLHNILHDMNWLKNRDSATVLAHIDAWGCYNTILLDVFEALEPTKVVTARCLFGFKPPSSDLYASSSYLVAEGSLISQCAPKYPFTAQRNSHNSLLVPARWVDKIIKDEIFKQMNERHRKILRSSWTSPRILKPHARPSTSLGPTNWESFYKQLRNQLQILNAAIEAFTPICHIHFSTNNSRTNPSLVQVWVRRLFKFAYPLNGTFGELVPSFPSQAPPNHSASQTCIRQFFAEEPAIDFSALIMVKSLLIQLDLNSAGHEIDQLLTKNIPDDRLSEKDMMDALFDWEDVDGLDKVNEGLWKIFQSSEEPLDAAVLVHLVEMITCELLFHMHAANFTSSDRFSGLLLPYSWAKVLAKRYAQPRVSRGTDSLPVFVEVVTLISDGLKYDDLREWWIETDLLSGRPDMAHILQLRLCWCISLLIVNSSSSPLGFSELLIDSLAHIAEDPGDSKAELLYHRFGTVTDQISCLQSLCETLNHEPLVGMLPYGGYPMPLWQHHPDAIAIPFTEASDMTNALQECLRS